MRTEFAACLKAALVAGASLLLASCSGLGARLDHRLGGNVRFRAELDAALNQDFPLAVDLVIVYDPELLDELGRLSAAEWFAGRDQIRVDGEPQRLEVNSWEWVPPGLPGGWSTDILVVYYRRGARGGIVFADYLAAGDHRASIDLRKSFTLLLRADDLELGPPPDPR